MEIGVYADWSSGSAIYRLHSGFFVALTGQVIVSASMEGREGVVRGVPNQNLAKSATQSVGYRVIRSLSQT